ncbi:MAG TPA: hemolysin family protein, partial [Bacillota bacterium]|nr:hemolysin family protein [Bacillota bacterium]
KRIAMEKSEGIARLAARPLNILAKVSGPFVRFLSFSTNLVIRLLGGNPAIHEERITEEEIRLMVDVGQERGVIRRTEKEMIDNIFKFDNTTAAAVMTHRLEIVALPWEATGTEVINTLIREKYSRIPVYRDTIDNIVGILHVQDLLPVLKNFRQEELDLKTLIKPPYFVPFAKKTDELLRELQRTKNHMAVVIDEYGGTAGIVTIEDLLEEIVGSIFDERDEDFLEVEELDERTFLVTGTLSLDAVGALIDLKLPHQDYDTLGGFVMAGLGRIPEPGEQPVYKYRNISFQVVELDDKRIAKIKIAKL